MSSLELEARYPELLRLDADPRLGRVGCRYCAAVFPGELPRCPACGAPHRPPFNRERARALISESSGRPAPRR